MFEIKNWNGHRVLAIPRKLPAQDPVIKAYAAAARGLADDLGARPSLWLCRLCPMCQTDAETGRCRCAHPRGIDWTATQDVARGGCSDQAVVAEEYIPLVKMRLGE